MNRARPLWVIACVSLAAVGAWSRRWMADDAYISFRYAHNLVRGHGLVFNPGERVEGYSNFLWTVWTAPGLALGVAPETWSQLWGLAAYLAMVGLLAAFAFEPDEGPPVGPVAATGALLAATHPVLWTFATGGLETSAFSLFVLWGLLRASRARSGRDAAIVGLLLAVAYLLRPEGALFFLCALGLSVVRGLRTRSRAPLYMLAAGAALALPQLVFRLVYYEALMPNTYHAKSAGLAWYSQGITYGLAHFQQYWPSLLGLPMLALIWLRRGRPGAGPILLAVASMLYGFYVVRVGGDFMNGRFWVPAIAPLLMLLQWSLAQYMRPKGQLAVALALAAALQLWPGPAADALWQVGIVDERTFVDPVRDDPRRLETLRKYFQGLPVRLAFTGGDARLMYQLDLEAVEAEAGLTDRRVAAQPLARRGRVGHEKHASRDYLINERRVHFTLRSHGARLLGLDQEPITVLQLDQQRLYVLHWDRPLMEELRRRGGVLLRSGP